MIISGIIIGIIQATSATYIIYNLNKYKIKNIILLCVLLSVYLSIAIMFIPNQFRFFSFILVLTLIIRLVLKIDLSKSFIISLVTMFISAISFIQPIE